MTQVRAQFLGANLGIGGKTSAAAFNLGVSFSGRVGDLILATGSVHQSGTYVFDVATRAVGQTGAKHLPFWDVAGGNDTMFTLWNPSGAPEDIVATFLFAGGSGRYRLPLHLAGYASQSINVAQPMAAEQPDPEGNVIPRGAERGSVEFAGPGGLGEPVSLAVGDVTFNVRGATWCPTQCIACVGLLSCAITPNPLACPVGSSAQATATGSYSNGSTEDDTSKSSWSSNATSIATVETKRDTNPGLVSGVSPGTATVTIDDPSFASGKACGLFPTCTVIIVACSLPVNSAPFITSISPAQGPIGASTAVTISGGGFGTSPSVSTGSGITATVNSANDTQIQAAFQIATTAPAGNHTVTVTAAGQTSNGVNFFVQVPTSLVHFDTSCTPGGVGPLVIVTNGDVVDCRSDVLLTGQCGVYRNLTYQLVDQTRTQAITQAYTITENFSNFSSTIPGETPPTSRSTTISAGKLAGDTQYLGFDYPTCLGPDQNDSFNQSFTVTVSGTTYPLTTVVTISRGRFSGTYEVNANITTP